ncbi:hypothetical protein pb186bvf_004402, partial [Paramecium bursaria]
MIIHKAGYESQICILQNITRNESTSVINLLKYVTLNQIDSSYSSIFPKVECSIGQKIKIFKESIKPSMKLSDEQNEILQLRNDSYFKKYSRKAMCVKQKAKLQGNYNSLNYFMGFRQDNQKTNLYLSSQRLLKFKCDLLLFRNWKKIIYVTQISCQLYNTIHSNFTSFSACSTYFAFSKTIFNIKQLIYRKDNYLLKYVFTLIQHSNSSILYNHIFGC